MSSDDALFVGGRGIAEAEIVGNRHATDQHSGLTAARHGLDHTALVRDGHRVDYADYQHGPPLHSARCGFSLATFLTISSGIGRCLPRWGHLRGVLAVRSGSGRLV